MIASYEVLGFILFITFFGLNKRDKDIKDGYIELEYDYNYLEISMKDNLYGTLDDYTTNENILIENNTRNHKVFYAEV